MPAEKGGRMSAPWIRSVSSATVLVVLIAASLGAQAAGGVSREATGGPEQVVTAIYELVSAMGGSTPDWAKVRACFLPQAVVVLRTSRTATNVFSLDGFIKDFVDFYEKPFVRGTTTLYPNKAGFTEKVIKMKSWEFWDMAQVLVLYEASITGDSRAPQRGIDNWLLSRRDGRWLVVAITNDLITADHPVPPELQ
jgi:hypothetical protein